MRNRASRVDSTLLMSTFTVAKLAVGVDTYSENVIWSHPSISCTW